MRAGSSRMGRGAASVAVALAVLWGCGGESATGPGNGGGDGGDVGVLDLAVGESRVVQGGSDGLSFTLPGPGDAGAEYRLAVHSASESQGATAMRLNLSGGSASSSLSARRRGAGTAGWRTRPVSPEQVGLLARTRLQEGMREMLVRRGIRPARREPGGRGVQAARFSSAALTTQDTVTLSFPVFEPEEGVPEATCKPDSAETVVADVRATGERVAMLEDTATSDLGSQNMDYQALADQFDQLVFGVDEAYFGSATDIDGNGVVMVLFSPKVNDLSDSDPDSEAFISGFFLPGDLADAGQCEAANRAELLYIVAADPAGNRDAGMLPADTVEKIARSTSSHEFQHLLNAANRVIKQNGSFADLEEVWLSEALSHVAEEIVGFAQANLAVRSNLTAPEAGANQGGSAERTFDTFHRGNLNNLALFLEEPASTQALTADQDPGGLASLRMRGFGWIFARWLADRENAGATGQVPGTGDPEEGFFRDLAKADGQGLETGIQNVEAVTGRQWADVLGGFAAVPAVDDDVSGLAQRHRLLSWNLRQIYRSYPLDVQSTGFGSGTFDFSVQAGGGRHIFVGTDGPAGDVVVELTDQTGQPLAAGSPQITVVRTR